MDRYSPARFKNSLLSHYLERLRLIQKALSSDILTLKIVNMMIAKDKTLTPDKAMEELNLECIELLNAIRVLRNGQIMLFPLEQASIFQGISTTYTESLDYRLPFTSTILLFDSPIEIRGNGFDDEVVAVLLEQNEITTDGINQVHEEEKRLKLAGIKYINTDVENNVGKLANIAIIVFSDTNIRKLTWISGHESTFEAQAIGESPYQKAWNTIKNLAIACIGYINCENVYLHKEGGVPDAINRKRERKGKSRLEPYYVCHIRGVNYDSHATGIGTGHGHRYDVRGHFRRLGSGKVTWVRPHIRGLANELYIPKVYKVDKENQHVDR